VSADESDELGVGVDSELDSAESGEELELEVDEPPERLSVM
jgi:hypothetical protein